MHKNNELRHTWQLFLMSDHHYQSYGKRPVYYFNPPILLRFDEHQFNITQDC
ncbi:MAG: hypothetical protein Q3971_03865 [Moraxella sp.]|nr:hypothetical protein [Moraxella sp.]